MIDLSPTEEQRLLQATAREFAAGEVKPIIDHVRRGPEPDDPWPIAREMYARGAGLGFTRLLIPAELGGLGGSALDAVILLEELGAADVGLAADLFAAVMTMPLMLIRAGTPEQSEAFLERFLSAEAMVLAGAQSEPNVAGSELMLGGPDPAFGPKLAARRDGDGWVLTGQKSAFITNAGAADEFFVICRTDPAQPVLSGLTIFHLPRATPGFSVGPRTKLIGWPLSTHAQLVFEDVRLPDSARVGAIGGAAMAFGMIPEMPVCLAACFIGLARAALDYAVGYAKQRISCGRPIIEHQAVALKLAEMARELMAARLMVWDAAWACAADPMSAGMVKAPAAKAKAVDVAIRNSQLCIEVLGAYGVAAEYEAGRYLADAMVGYACDFTREVLHLGLARTL